MPANHERLQRITARPEVFGGKPIIRDLRVSVELVLGLLAQGIEPGQSSMATPTWSSTTSVAAPLSRSRRVTHHGVSGQAAVTLRLPGELEDPPP